MSLILAVRHAKKNPIVPKGRSSISRFGAVLTNRHNTYFGWNSYKSHPLQAEFSQRLGDEFKIHVHAETSVCIQATRNLRFSKRRDLSDYTLFVARVLSDGTVANARPCAICLGMIQEFGIKEVEYTE